MTKRIFITGGHLTPALAVCRELHKNPDLEVYYLGRKHSLEGDPAISAEFQVFSHLGGVHFLTMTTGRLQRRLTINTLPSLFKTIFGFCQAFWYLAKFHPALILSFGGYVAVPVAIAAWIVKIPVITHEQTTVPGLATRIVSFFASKILVSWPETVTSFPTSKVIYTGNPVREEIHHPQKTNLFQSFFKIKRVHPKLSVIYLTGGSQGSHFLNSLVAEMLPKLLQNHLVIHQTGRAKEFHDRERLEKLRAQLNPELSERYFLFDYVGSQDIGWVFAQSDIVIGRAGANSVFDLAALGKPAILIPLPWSGGGEQQKNAQALAHFGAAFVLDQDKLTVDGLLTKIKEVDRNLDFYKTRALSAKKLINPQAAKDIVKIVLAEIQLSHET